MCEAVVVGAGIAGLTAAYKLRAAGVNVVVLEGASQVGGRMSTARTGLMFERGAQVLSSRYSTLMPLLAELDLLKELRELPQWHAIAQGGRIARLCPTRRVASWQSGLLTTKSWLRLAWTLARCRDTRRLHPSHYASWESWDTQDALAWSHEVLGQDVAQRLLEPSLQAFYFHDLAGTSRALALAQLAYLTQPGQLYTLAHGLQSLPEALAAALDVRTQAVVTAVNTTERGVTVRTEHDTYCAQWAIISVPGGLAQQLYTTTDPLERELMSVAYNSTITLGVGLVPGANVASPAFFGLGFAREQEPVLAGIGVDSHKHFDAPATDFTLTVRGEVAASLWQLSDDTLAAHLLERGSKYIPVLNNAVHSVQVARWLYASPQSPVGRSRNVAAYRRNWQPQRRVLLAGDYLGTPCTDGAAETGQWAAARLLREVTGIDTERS